MCVWEGRQKGEVLGVFHVHVNVNTCMYVNVHVHVGVSFSHLHACPHVYLLILYTSFSTSPGTHTLEGERGKLLEVKMYFTIHNV